MLGIKSLEELDIWIFLKTGEWISNTRTIPTKDIFSYTLNNASWTHIKWGYSYMAYTTQNMFGGAEGVMILQSVCNIMIAFLIYRIFSVLNPNKKTFSPVVIFLFYLLLWAGTEHRMNGRPEIFSHLFTTLLGYIFLASEKNKKYIWLCIPLFFIWSNIHDAYTLGILMMLCYLLVKLIIQIRLKNISYHLFLLGFLTIGVTIFNPLGILSLQYAYNIFTQLQTNVYTPELFSCFYPEYWQTFSTYIFISYSLLYIYALRTLKNHIPTWHMLISVLLFVIGLNAYRNIVFFMYWATPIFIYLFHVKTSGFIFIHKVRQYVIFLILSLLLYISVTNNYWYQIIHSKHRFGLYYDELKHPVKAAEFLSQHHEGNVFSDYLSSSYLLWKLYPNFSTYIDLRDLDVFTPEFFKEYYSLLIQPTHNFKKTLQKYHINKVALYLKTSKVLHEYMYHLPGWKLTYLDHNMAIYKENSTDELFYQNSVILNKISSKRSNTINKMVYPFYLNKADTIQLTYTYAKYYEMVGEPLNALKILESKSDIKSQNISELLLYGKLLTQLSSKENNYLTKAIYIYKQVIQIDSNNFLALKGITWAYYLQNNYKEALNYASKAFKINPTDSELNVLMKNIPSYAR